MSSTIWPVRSECMIALSSYMGGSWGVVLTHETAEGEVIAYRVKVMARNGPILPYGLHEIVERGSE